ncbi:MAG: single-stranded-DNA-specific exonuclease RecJ [Bacteriovoracaceae bacterium]|nr:single-stranded-DNA-specific exonuclease RecJ [Bacteriovoracaceae bacterium]
MNAQILHPVVIKLLESKGLNKSEFEEFFSWDLKALPDLTSLKDTQKASSRIIDAILANEQIGIYGDYDVDGTTSCATFYQFFKMVGVNVELFQPSRFVEGYGLHNSSIDKALERGVKVLITVDCGISSSGPADYALEKNIDLIITDHHEDAAPEIPKAYAIINPSRRDEPADWEQKSLAGVGVAFALCMQIRKDLLARNMECPSIYPLLQYVAVGTVCDLAKLNPMNLKLVRHGLKQILTTQYPGLKIFFSQDERKAGFVPSEKLSFGIGPMINSKGRLDHPEKALRLLNCTDSDTAFNLYSHLDACNKERKLIQSEVYAEAKEQAKKSVLRGEHLISIVYAPEWHEGVIGIVASRLVEEFKVPAIVFTNSSKKGIIKASARSASELDMFKCLNACSDLFIKFGGHKAAAGLSMEEDKLPLLRNKMKTLLKDVPEIERVVQDHYDLEISLEEITPRLAKNLEMMEPFGMGNSKPLFKSKGVQLDSFSLMKDVHVRWNLSSQSNPKIKMRGVTFNHIGKYGIIHPDKLFEEQRKTGKDLTIYYRLGINRFNGNEYLQLMVEKITYDEL